MRFDLLACAINLFRVLIVNSLHFVQKNFRHQDTKTQSLIFANSFALCLCALVAIFPVYPG
jgi:hypothetical protein